jgi:hypothetical protein
MDPNWCSSTLSSHKRIYHDRHTIARGRSMVNPRRSPYGPTIVHRVEINEQTMSVFNCLNYFPIFSNILKVQTPRWNHSLFIYVKGKTLNGSTFFLYPPECVQNLKRINFHVLINSWAFIWKWVKLIKQPQNREKPFRNVINTPLIFVQRFSEQTPSEKKSCWYLEQCLRWNIIWLWGTFV